MPSKLLKIFGMMMMLVVAISAVGVLAQDSEPAVVADVIPDILYVRSGPGSSFEIVGEVRVFTQVEVYGRNDAVTWVYVSNGSVTGWVNAAYLRFPDGFNVAGKVPIVAANISAPSDVTNTSVVPAAGQGVVVESVTGTGVANGSTKVAANFRRGPGTQFGIITTLGANTPISVIGRNAAGTWFKVQAVGQEGWIFGELLTIDATRSSLPVVDGSTPATTTTTTPNATPAASTATTTTTTTTQSGGRYSNLIVGVGPGGNKEFDGRLNPTTRLGNAIVYCINGAGYTDRGISGGGIAILHYAGPSQGVVFYATEAEINAVGIPADIQLIKAESGYYLYRRFDRLFELRAVNVDGAENFVFRWLDCNAGPATPAQ